MADGKRKGLNGTPAPSVMKDNGEKQIDKTVPKKLNLGQQLVYQLLYPAFLGSFIVGIAVHMPPLHWGRDWDTSQIWGPLFALYFALQLLRVDDEYPKGLELLVDFVEMCVMAALFVQLGYGVTGPNSATASDTCTRWLMVGAILIPPVKRLITSKISDDPSADDPKGQNCWFTRLSLFAVILLAISFFDAVSDWVGIFGLAACLAIYLGIIAKDNGLSAE